MSTPFVFSFVVPASTIEKPLVSASGKPIQIGDILRHEDGRSQGVVTWIGFPDAKLGAFGAPALARIGDIEVKESDGTSRISNQYEKWSHVPRGETTYWQRLKSWVVRPFHYEEPDEDVQECNRISKGEALACDGIMALLPNDPVDWEYGDWPDRIEVAFGYLLSHLEEITTPAPNKP
jgi:hypothetical protein